METKERGQSLLEVTIAIGVAVLIVTAITIVTVNGLRNSQFAQNQTQATKLAQDGLEQVKAVRDRDGIVTIGSSTASWSSQNWSGCGSGCTFSLGRIDSQSLCAASSNFNATACLLSSDSSKPQPIPSTIFYSLITILDCSSSSSPPPECGANQKKITSEVSWSDFSGSHQSYLETILANI